MELNFTSLHYTALHSHTFNSLQVFWMFFFTNFQAPSGTGFIRFMCNGHWNFITWITRHQLQILKCHSTHDSPIFAAFSPGGFRSMLWKIAFCISNKNNIAESFYNVKNGSSIITSKSLSKNLSNENTGVFVVFKTKCELKCQFSGNTVCVCFHYWDSLTNFLT